MAAQAAVGFIKQGCAMLHEGRMELEGAKKTVEGVIADVKAIKSIWQWFINLFAGKAETQADVSKPVEKRKQQSSNSHTNNLNSSLSTMLEFNLENSLTYNKNLKTTTTR